MTIVIKIKPEKDETLKYECFKDEKPLRFKKA